VLANIRGGGEYGPSWHKAALREKRQNSFDDLEAVARDLIARGIARQDGIAISGRSNGGVLTGAAITQHPDLYRAAIIGSPLFDMQRYSQLSAGASWIDEYGDPEKPTDWAFMSRYSPYQTSSRTSATLRPSSICRPRTTGSILVMRARERRSLRRPVARSIITSILKAATRSARTGLRTPSARLYCGRS